MNNNKKITGKIVNYNSSFVGNIYFDKNTLKSFIIILHSIMVKKVLKFGGTSVGTTQRIHHVANIIKKEREMGNKIIAVVSAMAGKTNELISYS